MLSLWGSYFDAFTYVPAQHHPIYLNMAYIVIEYTLLRSNKVDVGPEHIQK